MAFPCGTSNIEDELMAHEMTWVNPEDDVPLQEQFSPQSTMDDSNLKIMSATDVQEYFVEDFEELRNNVLDDPENSPYIGNLEKLQSLAYNASDAIKLQIHQYTSDFQGSMALRKCFSNMIEKKLWYIILCNTLPSQDHINAAKSIVNEFYNSVENYLSESASIGLSLPDRDSLLRWQNQCRISYFSRPIEFIDVIQKMLNKERSIILNAQALEQADGQQQPPQQHQQSTTPSTNMFVVNNGNEAQSPAQQVVGTGFILNEISLTDSMLMDLRVQFEKICKQYQRLQALLRVRVPEIDPRTLEQVQDPEQKAAWMKVYQEINTCREDKRTMLDKHFTDLIERLKVIINSVLNEISRYRSSMALKMIGEERGDAPEIDRLQDCCKLLGQVVQNAMDHVDRLSKLVFADITGEDENKTRKAMLIYQDMFKNLVKSCIVIDKHPCQVVMKEKKFIVELRHLLGTALPQTQFETTVALIDSATYKKLKQDQPVEMREVGKIKVKNSGGGGRTRSTTNTDTGQVAIKFNNMSISIAARGGDKTKSETVAEEKLTMLFRSTIPVTFCNGESTSITCQTFSLPLVVTTHGKQEADANATIFWDNAFQIPNRIGFDVYESVPWENWLYYLDLFWRRHCESEPGYAVNMEGKGLDHSARQFLTNTFFGTQVKGAPPPVSWKQVSRNQLPKREFSFWTWFYKIVELVSSSYVKKFWKKGYIKGFISRQTCESLLVTRPFGTFMLRFSESMLGSLVITVFTHNQGMGNVINLEPDNIHSFRHKRSLPGNMKDLRQLEILYPDICKDDAFREYWEPENKSPDQLISPYVQKLCKVTIED